MKTTNFKLCFLAIALVVLMTMVGCKPSIHDVVKVISKVPIGASRAEIWNALVKEYPKQVWPDEVGQAPRPLRENQIQTDKNLIKIMQKERGRYLVIYPSNLYDGLHGKIYFDMVGMIREATEGGGFLEVFYDSNTNYIGFFANAYK